jgi:hypothetical protein
VSLFIERRWIEVRDEWHVDLRKSSSQSDMCKKASLA